MTHKLLTTVIALLLFFSFFSTVSAEMEERVTLHFSHVGADSTKFSSEKDCGGVDAPVVWHLVLNQLDKGTEPLTVHAVFKTAGHETAVGRSVGIGKVQHFYIGTADDDILLEAYVDVTGQSGTPKLLLSHVCHKDQEDKKDDDQEKDKEDKKDKDLDKDDDKDKKDVPAEEPKVDPDDKKDVPKIDEDKELPQTNGGYSQLIPLSIILAAGGLLLKNKKY